MKPNNCTNCVCKNVCSLWEGMRHIIFEATKYKRKSAIDSDPDVIKLKIDVGEFMACSNFHSCDGGD